MGFTIAVIRERRAGETRVAATPDTVRKFIAMGAEVLVETGAGAGASYPDAAYAEAGARVVGEVLDRADVVLSVRGPEQGQASALKKGAAVVALFDPYREKDLLQALAKSGASAFAMEFVPRISRAQAMDALSSQANLAGYRAVIEAAEA